MSRVSADVFEQLTTLAGAVRDELARAGLPATVKDMFSEAYGALVEIDAGDDEAGGVFVRWAESPALSEPALDAFSRGDLDHPAFKHSSRVAEAMANAMLAILRSAGFAVEMADEDVNPGGLAVTAGPA